jgi:hypothetical protein
LLALNEKYRRQFVQYLISELERNPISPLKLDVLGAIRYIVQAWIEVSSNTIRNCWYHTGMLKKPKPFETQTDDESKDLEIIKDGISQLRFSEPMNVNEYINYPEERIIEEVVNESSMNETDNCEKIEECEELDDTKIEPQITHSKALKSCKKLINYLEQQSDNFSSQISSLYNLKQKIERN